MSEVGRAPGARPNWFKKMWGSYLQSIFRAVDRLSLLAAYLAQAILVLLVLAMMYEVLARYLFNAPTIWAFDVSYMLTGVMFILGTSWTTKEDGHVRIDFLVQRLPAKLSALLNGLIYFLLLTPLLAALSWSAWRKALRAIATGEVESVSVWAPPMWPFFLALAIGLTLLALQVAVEGLRSLHNAKSD